jgi:hypothetical protein
VTISFRILLTFVLVLGPFATFLEKQTATAMDFSTQRLPDGDHYILAKGEIVAGDTERLRLALQLVGRNRYGDKEMALESGGGLVGEALKMVGLMDEEKVSTVVLPGATCASACAQIVFLAGIHRIVAEGGKLGMHTCAMGRNRSPLCNQTIAQNALEHGTAYGSVIQRRRLLWVHAMASRGRSGNKTGRNRPMYSRGHQRCNHRSQLTRCPSALMEARAGPSATSLRFE